MIRKHTVQARLPQFAPPGLAMSVRRFASRRRLLLPLCMALCASLSAAAPAAANDNDTRSIIVSGQGIVTAMPDRAMVSLTAESRNTELETARDEVNRVVRDLLRLARSLGIEDQHINATAITVRPEYDWNPQRRERVFIGYHVARRVDIDLRQLERLGALLEGAVDRGITQIGEPELKPGNPAELRREALALAAEDARLNAVSVAETLGGRVGPARRIIASEDSPNERPRPMMMEARAAADGGAADSYAAGELSYSARIEITFDLLMD
jgi:uncharacterized protein